MKSEKSSVGVVNCQIEYAKKPITSFDGYLGIIGNELEVTHGAGNKGGYPVLITLDGEKISEKDIYDSERKLENSHLLREEPVAKYIAENKGYLFFPKGKIDESKVFSREFLYRDFVSGFKGVIGNIDPGTTCDTGSYAEYVKRIYEELKGSFGYLEKVVLKWNTCDADKDFRIVGELDSKYVGGLKWNENGFRGVSLKIGMETNPHGTLYPENKKLNAGFYVDDCILSSDFDILSATISRILERSDLGGNDQFNMEYEKVPRSVNINFSMRSRDNHDFVFPTNEMINRFSYCLHVVSSGIKNVGALKRLEYGDNIRRLEKMIGVK